MISADIQTVMPEIILAIYAMLALMVAVYTTKDAMAPLLTWMTSGLFVLLAFYIGIGDKEAAGNESPSSLIGIFRVAFVWCTSGVLPLTCLCSLPRTVNP